MTGTWNGLPSSSSNSVHFSPASGATPRWTTSIESAEDLIGQVFGAASDEAEAYWYAKNGESAILPEEAQENGTHNVEREALQQRRQVLESCLADLQLRRRLQLKRQKGREGNGTLTAAVEE